MATVRKRSWTTAKGEKKSAWAVDFVDQVGTRQRKQFHTKREADSFRIDIEGQLRVGTFRPDATKVTVRDVCDSYLDHCRGRMLRGERMTRHNLAVYEGHVFNYICPDPDRRKDRKPHPRMRVFTGGIAAAKLGQLTARAVGEFRDRLRDAGVSVPTVRKILATVHGILEYAIGRDLIAVNAARGVKVIGRRDEGNRKIVTPTKQAIKSLIDVADQEFQVKLIVASATGLRAGEFHALRWRHLDLDKAEMTVETRVDAYGEEDVTKTAAGMRTIPIGQGIVTVLKALKLRSKFSKADDLVFPNKRGGYEGHGNMVKRQFNPLFDKLAELHKENPLTQQKSSRRFNWHALRHFAVSCWIEAGLDPKTVQTFAGHSSLQVTMDRYGHLFKSEDHKRAMDTIATEVFK
jgi:integrase